MVTGNLVGSRLTVSVMMHRTSAYRGSALRAQL
jgi:hypothetical protein